MPVTNIKAQWSSGDLQFLRSEDGDEVARIGSTFLIPKVKKLEISADFDNTEQNTGWALPAKAVVLDVVLDVTTADASQTLDVGTDGSGSNDPNGFLAAVSVNAQGVFSGSLANGAQTRGALLSVDESGAGVLVPRFDTTSGGESITYTGSDTTNTMRGAIYVIYIELV